jgi:hypothetical protein
LTRLLASPPASTPSPGADRFHYDVHVTDDTRVLKVREHAMPAELTDSQDRAATAVGLSLPGENSEM